MVPDMFSILPWPKGCLASAGRLEVFTENRAITAASQSTPEGRDDMYRQAVEEVRRAGKASISLLQRRLRIGYSRAARLIDQMEADGIVGPELGGTRGREVLPERTQNQASN